MISIIIVTHNRITDVYDLLQHIGNFYRRELLSEVVVLDNASTPAIPPMMMNDVKVVWVRSEVNLGATGGRNYATTFATGDILVYFDDDAVVTDISVLQTISKTFDEGVGLVAFNILHYHNGMHQLNAFPHKKYNKYKAKKTFLTSFYAASGYAIKHEVWNKIGGYPTTFSIYMEEYDVAYQVIEAGYKIKFDADVVVHHKKSPRARTKREEFRLYWVNKALVAFKYLPLPYFITTVFMWSLFYLYKSNMHLKSWFHSWVFILMIPLNEKRNPISSKTYQYLKSVEARLWY
jgi:GT2 family glycosyltransferase